MQVSHQASTEGARRLQQGPPRDEGRASRKDSRERGALRGVRWAFPANLASVAARWKRIDRVSNRGEELPPVSLYNIGDSYVVEDRNRRVSVTHYQGMEMIDAEIVELHARIPAAFAENTGAEGGIMLVVERATKKEERRRC
jgi:hypothetical protein